jgi:hypothetical protein
MTENVTKVEGLAFTAKDEASATADKIGQSFERVHHAAEGARQKIGEFARNAATGALASVGLGFGLHSVYEKAKEANLEMDRVRKSVAGAQFTFQGWRPGLSQLDQMNHSIEQAADNTEKLEAMELKLHAPLEELGQTYNAVAAVGFGRLHMSQQGVLELTEKITAASKIYGIGATEAIETVNRALVTGTVRGISPFQIALREALDLEHHKGGKRGKKLTTDEMFERMDKKLAGMVPVAQKFGDNMAGSMFEAEALVGKMLEDLGGPLFREQSKSLSEWVQKLRTVKEDGKSLVAIYGEKIAGAFQTIKQATAFIVDHWKLLLGLYATSKFASFASGFAGKSSAVGKADVVAGAIGEAGAGATGTMAVTAGVVNVNSTAVGKTMGAEMNKIMRPSLSETVGKFAGVASKALMVTEALGGLYIAADGLASWIDHQQTQGLQKQQNAAALVTATHNFERSLKAMKEGETTSKLAIAGRMNAKDLATKNDANLIAWDALEKSRVSATASMKSAFEALGMKQGQKVSVEGISGLLGGLPSTLAAETVNKLAAVMPQMIHKTTAGGIEQTPAESAREIANAMNDYAARLFGAAEKESPNVNRTVPRGHGDINIQNLTITQDFKEADPDRVFHRVTNEISGLANSPGKGRLSVGMSGGL